MKYDFDNIPDRRGTNSLKWHIRKNEIPMWVADMDFKTAPEIIESLKKQVDFGIFGYSVIPDRWYDAYINHWKNRHDFEIKRQWLIYSSGVLPTISTAVRRLTLPAEKVILMTPVYNVFFNCVLNNGRNVVESPLILNDKNKYEIDFNDLEIKMADPQTTMLILCNPQNPSGRVWTKDELERIGELALENGVTVVSDEIHCDIIDPGVKYTPFAAASEICRDISVTCIAPTKCFNIAGIQTSAVIVPDKFIRQRIWRGLNTDECGEPNIFAVPTAIAAFEKGGEWLDELNKYLKKNKMIARGFFEENLPKFKFMYPDATYLAWIDISEYGMKSKEFAAKLRQKTGVYLSNGEQYGTGGENFVRMNLATNSETVKIALNRIKDFD